MRFGTFCSGICAPEVAWRDLGWRPQFFSEIEPFPIAVQRHRFPDVPNLGDMERISSDTLGQYPVDLVCAGTPCQAFSVAGLRKGLADPRGNLTLVFLRLLDELRPAWVVWENVPGVLSCDGGRAFGAFLGGLGQLGYGFAYRILDAQYAGVPQRRRRVFVVGHLGDWRRAAAVLFERHSLSGDLAPSREAGQRVAGCLSPGAHPGGFNGQDAFAGQLVGFHETGQGWWSEGPLGLRAEPGGMPENVVTHALRGEDFDASEDGTGRGTPIVPVGFAQNSRDEVRLFGGDGQTTGSLAAEPGMKQTCYVAFTDLRGRGCEIRVNGDVAEALHCAKGMSEQQAVAFQTRIARNGRGKPETVCPTLQGAGAGATSDMRPCVSAPSGVRRLTPRECERLQGFPDNWTLVPFRNKPAADGPRYRAIGNSMAVPVMRWIGQRIQAVQQLTTGVARG